MTYEEAIKVIESNRPTAGYTMLCEALDIAKEALEKQIPKKPTRTIHKYRMENTTELGQYTLTHCPSCFENKELGYFESLVDKGTKYCRRCGQALDWSDTE